MNKKRRVMRNHPPPFLFWHLTVVCKEKCFALQQIVKKHRGVEKCLRKFDFNVTEGNSQKL